MNCIVSSWCPSCGKAKSYTITYGKTESVMDTLPELCTCNHTISILPSSNTSYMPLSPTSCLARLTPENMQELEAMIRRVVHEEVSVIFEEDEQEPEDTTPSPFIGQD